MVSAKKVTEVPGCSKCPHKCNTMITRNERCVIFKSFYSLAQNEKKQFILQQSERVICARKIKKDEAGPSRRDFSFKYFLTIKNEKTRVCKQFFFENIRRVTKNDIQCSSSEDGR